MKRSKLLRRQRPGGVRSIKEVEPRLRQERPFVLCSKCVVSFLFFFVCLFLTPVVGWYLPSMSVSTVYWLSVCVIRLGFCLPATMFVDNDVWLNMNAKCSVAAVQSWNRTLPRPQAEWLVADDGCQPLVVCLRLQASELDLRAACEPCTQLMKSPTLVPAEKPHRCLSST